MLLDLFSRRRAREENAGKADIYVYDSIPDVLRVQCQQILLDALGPHALRSGFSSDIYIRDNSESWTYIAKGLRKEFGVYRLADGNTAGREVINFLKTASVEQFIDAIELCLRELDLFRGWSEHQRAQRGIEQEADEAIDEINARFRQAGVGYQFADYTILRLDSEFAHEEMVRPALTLLKDHRFAGPQAEFLTAHRLYRNGDFSQAVTEAAKSFESMLKVVCEIKGWTYEKGSRASDLLKRVRSAGLWPDYLDASFDQLIATLNSGLPKVRNEEGAHGRGSTARETPSFVAAYALHLAAAKIILIGEASAV